MLLIFVIFYIGNFVLASINVIFLSLIFKIVQNLSNIICNSKKNPKETPKKNTNNLKVTINSIVENILAVVNPDPSPVKSMTTKHVKPAKVADKLPKALSKLFPNDNLI